MPDQKNNQSNEKTSPGQQTSARRDDEQSTQPTPDSRDSSRQPQSRRDDESTGWDVAQRERSSREPVSTANDSGLGAERRSFDSFDTDDSSFEDVADKSSISESDDEDTGGSSR